ncbi:hypothetical protein [Afipia carboxidovorans]|uniref:hypothetical protein n=1 Tax=Afipia carboxidovorans TaxID=40137 RepID=UPI0030850C38|nr:hypothetical protein CRBSH125_08610 [Afipia carboxidovorans]
MVIIARKTAPNTLEVLDPVLTITAPDGTQWPWQIVDLWTDEELAAIDIYRIQQPPAPEGKHLVSFTLGLEGDTVSYDPVYEDVVSPVLVASPWQLRKSLNHFELRAAIESFVANSADQDIKDAWEFATEFRRDHPFVAACTAALAPALDITSEAAETLTDQIFEYAVTA